MWSVLLIVAALSAHAHGHGRVILPPSRASAWRTGFNTIPNYDDDGNNCGGFYNQWGVHDGKCGICGDPYEAASPRAHELGGTYGAGVIVNEYTSGEVIDITVVITAYHKGYLEFKICTDPTSNDQDCFDKYLLELEDGDTKFYLDKGSGQYNLRYRLPEGLACDHCVLQWRYTCGNNWGNCNNGTQGLGCGPQENFLACSDIAIKASSDNAQMIIPKNDLPLVLNSILTNRDN